MTSSAGKADLEALLRKLVEIESENPPGNEAPCARFIADWLENRGIDTTLVREPFPNRPQVAARVGDGDPTVVLNGHIDVVPVIDVESWTFDPYQPVVEDGRMYGRGTADMKAGVALGMVATVALRNRIESGELDGSVVFHAAVGEEMAEPGTKALLDAGFGGEFGIVLEGTGLKTATRSKGLAWYQITIEGESAHASQPYEGRNAIQDARPVLAALANYNESLRERHDPLVGNASATTTMLDAGTKENIVPEQASITVDRRILPNEDVEQVDAEIDTLLERVTGKYDISVSWDRLQTYDSTTTATDSPIARALRDQSELVANVSQDPYGYPAACDIRYLVNEGEMDGVVWGPGQLEQAHSTNEYVPISEVRDGYEALLQAIPEIFDQ